MSITKREFVTGVSAAALASGVALPAMAARARIIKISHQFPAAVDFRDILCHKFAAAVEKETHGALRFEIYPGGSLYKPGQEFDAMASGALDMSCYPLPYSGGEYPPTSIALMPGIPDSYQQGYSWENAAIGKWLVGYLAAQGVVMVTWLWQGGGCASRKKPILVPADVKGLKTRGGGKMIELMLQAAGASISTFPSNETYDALRSGVVDALWTSSASLMSFRLDEVARDVTTAQSFTFWYMLNPLLMSKKTYDRLTAEQQKVVLKVGHEMQAYALAACQANDKKVAQVYAKAGGHVYDMDKAQFLQWKLLAKKSAWKDFASHVKDGQKLLDMAEAVA